MATTWLSGLSIPHGIAFRGNYMYIANRGTFEILQVPVNPDGSAGTAVSWYTFTGGVYPFWILIDQNTMYVHTSAGNIARILFVFDLPGTVLNPWATAGVPTPNGLVISGNYLYAASGAGVSSIFQINISTGIVVTSNWVDPSVVDRFHSLVIQGNFMYATNGATNQVSRIQINPDGSSGSIVKEWAPALTTEEFLTELIIAGPYMYVANSTDGTIAQVRMSDGSLVSSAWAAGFTSPHSFALRSGCLYVANYGGGSISKFCSSDLLLTDSVFNSCDSSTNVFQAFRPRSSSELLSLRKRQVEQSLNTVPTIARQDSSEQTARIRKYASVLPASFPLDGNSATMVKFKASSVVQSMVTGQAYRDATSRYVVPVQRTTPGCSNILPNFMQYGPLSPKEIQRSVPISNAAPQVVPFNPVVDLPLRRNDNKVVLQSVQVNTAGCGADQ